MQLGITLRDLVHVSPLHAIKQCLLIVAEQGKSNAFAGRIPEIEGLPDLKVAQAFELSDASAAGCAVKLNPEPIKEYLTSSIVLMKSMIADGYADKRSLERRIPTVEENHVEMGVINQDAAKAYRDINFDQIKEYAQTAKEVVV